MDLPQDVADLLRRICTSYIATVMPDGGPQLTQARVETDGEHIIINTVQGYAKLRNSGKNPRVAVAAADPANSLRFVQIRGRVIESTSEGGAEHIEKLSQKYLGQPYPRIGGLDQVRVVLAIEAGAVTACFADTTASANRHCASRCGCNW